MSPVQEYELTHQRAKDRGGEIHLDADKET